MNTSIDKFESGLVAEKHNAIVNEFNPLVSDLPIFLEEAKLIKVEDESDTESMKRARKCRLAIRSIRIEVENTRKKLKEASLREGKAIDGMANIIKHRIAPIEERLQEQEDFVKIAESKRIQALSDERAGILKSFDVDVTHFDLGNMKQEAFESLKASSEAGYKAKIKAEAEERQRQQQEAEKKAREESERRKREQALAEENNRLKAEKEAKEQAERQAEAQKKAEAQALLAAPDTKKIEKLREDILHLSLPAVESDIAIRVIADITDMQSKMVAKLTSAVKALDVKGE